MCVGGGGLSLQSFLYLDQQAPFYFLLQPTEPPDYRGLVVAERRRITQAGYHLQGLCYGDGWLYAGERHELKLGRFSYRVSHSLAVYLVQRDSGEITLLDRLELTGWKFEVEVSMCPRIDRHSRRVFIPCGLSGVTVAHLDGDRLVRERTLVCVREAANVDIMSSDTVYVGDRDSRSVHVVDVRNDRITSTLAKPDTVRDRWPSSLAVLGDSVIVSYGASGPSLVVYRHGSPTPVRVIIPTEEQSVGAVSTDWQHNILLTNREIESVFVTDISGRLCHTVNIATYSGPVDCAVVNRQLWVGCYYGDIVIMSSQ